MGNTAIKTSYCCRRLPDAKIKEFSVMRGWARGHLTFSRISTRSTCLKVSRLIQAPPLAKMAPKDKKKQRVYTPAHYSSHLQVFKVDNLTAAPSLLLFFDKERYLFNAGEGSQRLFRESKQKIAKMTKIFTTRLSPDTLAGLPGMLLSQVQNTEGDAATLLAAPTVSAAVYGPPGLQGYVEAFRQYASSFKLTVSETDGSTTEPVLRTDMVTISALGLRPSPGGSSTRQLQQEEQQQQQQQAQEEAEAGEGGPASKKPRLEEQPAQAVAATSSSGTTAGPGSDRCDLVLTWVCQLATIPGKFDPKKAAQLGVPRGPLFGELQRGTAVRSVSGVLVQPHEVMDTPTVPGALLLLLDCPTLAHWSAAAAHPGIQKLMQQAAAAAAQQGQQQGRDPQGEAGAANGSSSSSSGAISQTFVMVHMGPGSVISHPDYQAWMSEGAAAGWEHLVTPSDASPGVTTRRAAEQQVHLAEVEPQVFSCTGFKQLQEMYLQQQQQQQQQEQQQGVGAGPSGSRSWLVGRHLAKVVLSPLKHRGFQDEEVPPPLDFEALSSEVGQQRLGMRERLEQYHKEKEELEAAELPQQLQGLNREAFAVTLLGTCSACPTHLRNVSAYYLDLFERGGGLMDCGEDTMGQLARCYGPVEAERRISQLRFVWVSHMHADHHGGLVPLLLRRHQLRAGAEPSAPPLLILGPWPLFRVLAAYSKVLPLKYLFLPNNHFYDTQQRPLPPQVASAYEAVKVGLGLAELEPFPVKHVAHSTGIKLVGTAGWKVVFSGDTRPCEGVTAAAAGATLLVHEATFDDELEAEAAAKKHSTVSEALQVASTSGAYRTLLTHFSSRYPKLQVLNAGGTGSGDRGSGGGQGLELSKVAVGFDLMTVNAMDLPWMPLMVPVLEELCRDADAEEEEETVEQEG